MIESLLQQLIDALHANTAVHRGAPSSPSTTTPVPASATPAAAKPGPKPGPKPAAAPAPVAAPADDRMLAAREVLKKVLDTKGANEVRDILTRVGAAKLSDVKPESLDTLIQYANAAVGGAPAPTTALPGLFD